MSRDARRQHIEAGANVAHGAVKQTAEGVGKGAVEAAEAADTTTHFQYAPVFIALFPVFASFFFGSHTEHWTDLLLLALVAVYLHNCVSVPNNYYKASKKRYRTSNVDRMTKQQQEVAQKLKMAELQAFGGLVLGPLMGAFLLHYVRSSMARPANGLITNFNITVFVLAAEIRPLKIAHGYLTARSDRLQMELVDVVPQRYEELASKVAHLEAELAEMKGQRAASGRRQSGGGGISSGAGSATVVSSKRDAEELEQVRHALRRFERHEAQLKEHFDDKIYAIERHLADVAHRAPRISQTTGLPSFLQLVESCLLFPLRLSWSLVTLPVRALRSLRVQRQT